jgi:hypothetical protein
LPQNLLDLGPAARADYDAVRLAEPATQMSKGVEIAEGVTLFKGVPAEAAAARPAAYSPPLLGAPSAPSASALTGDMTVLLLNRLDVPAEANVWRTAGSSIKGSGPISSPAGAPTAAAADDMVTVYRFADITDPRTMVSRAATISQQVADEAAVNMGSPAWRSQRGDLHARGTTSGSPMISVGTNPASVAASTDPWLETIATGLPGHAGAAPAPFLLEFSVPRSLLYTPNYALSATETELLFMGDNLLPYLVNAQPNPFLLVRAF